VFHGAAFRGSAIGPENKRGCLRSVPMKLTRSHRPPPVEAAAGGSIKISGPSYYRWLCITKFPPNSRLIVNYEQASRLLVDALFIGTFDKTTVGRKIRRFLDQENSSGGEAEHREPKRAA